MLIIPVDKFIIEQLGTIINVTNHYYNFLIKIFMESVEILCTESIIILCNCLRIAQSK